MSDINRINDAWLNLPSDINEDLLFNPLEFAYQKCEGDITKIDKYLSILMTRPEYFYFVCKYIFNVEISPLQAVLLADMWNRKFPMLIGSRGLSKALRPDCPVLTPDGWVPIKDLKIGDLVYGSDGYICSVNDISGRQENLNFYRVSLCDGREIDACEDHLWKVWNGKKWQNLTTGQLTKSEKYKNFSIPVAKYVDFAKAELSVDPYILGVVASCETVVNSLYRVKCCKRHVIDKMSRLMPERYYLAEDSDGPYFYPLNYKDVNFSHLLSDFNLDEFTVKSSLKQRQRFFNGVLDACGTEGRKDTILRPLGASPESIANLARSLGMYAAITEDGIRIISNKEKVQITGISKSESGDGYCIKVDSDDRTYITKDFVVTHNSFTLSLYSMLRALLLPQRKIVVVGAAFRQSKVLYDYCDTIWKNAPVLRDICDQNSGLTRDVDRCQVKINDGTVVFLPLGDGCLTADTSVMFGDRFGMLGDLFDSRFADELDIPNFSPLLLYDGQSFRNSPYKRYNGLKQTIKITTELGYSVEGTFDHKMMSFSGWKKLRDFRVGDLLEINLSGEWHNGNSGLSENEAYQIGINLRGEIPREVLSSSKRVVKAFLEGVFQEGVYTLFGRGEGKGRTLMNIISRYGQLSKLKNGKISLIEGGPPSGQPYYDKIVQIEHGENYTYDVEVDVSHKYLANSMISHNSKIRGQRGHDILADEFASLPRDIFENVVAGFAAVASSPIEKMKKRAREKMAEELGIEIEMDDVSQLDFYKSNQIILSGTAYYDFNHFAEYWKRYSSIAKSGGDRNKLAEIFGEEVPDDFNWRDYAVYRIPVDLLPPGYMDEGQIARSKATVHSGIYQMEYGAVFSTDSKGFFKRTLIESCVCSEKKPIVLPSGEVFFSATTRGNNQSKYVIGVDPASEEDNFSIVVLEIMPDHRRVVYAWTTTRERYRESFKANITNEDNFYGYCARKIRDLMKTFPTVEIALDSQGGGIAVMEALHDREKLMHGELAIWPTIDPDKPAETDGEPGLHILRLCKFVDSMWTAEANHGLRKDLEDKVLIFPFFDSATLGFSLEDDKKSNRTSDTLEDCVIEIEQLKDELALIVLTQTNGGREKWDMPHGGFSSKTKSKLRKDRYSALLMANACARKMLVERTGIEYDEDYCRTVGFAERFVSKESGRDNYHGPAWFTEGAKDLY